MENNQAEENQTEQAQTEQAQTEQAQTEQAQTEQTQTETKKDSPWSNIGYGVFCLAFAAFLYYTFDNMEKEGGSVRINWIFALAYKLGGKWTVAVILAIIGSLFTYSGISGMIKKKKNN